MECQCEKDNSEDAFSGWWENSNSLQMGAFTVVGYLLYRFSQTLPALIRWPIRLFCSLTGLTALWSWVSKLVGTLRGIQSLFKWLSRLWRFVVAFLSKFKWLVAVIKSISGEVESKTNPTSRSPNKPDLRLILLGPTGGGRTSLADTLLGKTDAPMGPLMESTRRRTVVDGREVTVIDTPDLLGPSLGNNKRAREALRSLQLAGPGPHAFLLVIQVSGSSMGADQNATQAVQAALELFGDGVVGYIIPVLVHADRLGKRQTVDQLLDVDTGDLRRAVSLCGQRPELVDNRPDCPPEEQSVMHRQLVGRVMEVKELRGQFVHELQRREDHIREELLNDMASALARKLGHT
ncbi:immune-associated nucleotide-binding protein 5-like isoform X2 [Toxotes jaculatrix]|uniref:immune-associated nucleotide-binding protein 5-like isoform X2 n=1 Tax=Toxotes jaculatrix TaxID=941984 RepID=UPI001B3AFD8F|nr:immune-associated nucleotide-binding protein 5-like isoform X2 [Toxotes jaculatrix]